MEHAVAHAIVALIAIGMGVAFFLADRRAPTSRALALFLVSLGLAIGSYVVTAVFFPDAKPPAWLETLDVVFETTAFIAGFEWGLRVARTAAGDTHMLDAGTINQLDAGTIIIRVAQGLVVLYATLAILFPDLRAEGFGIGDQAGADLGSFSFYLFAAPLVLAGLLVVVATVMLLRQRLDRAEAVRVISLTCAMPFLAAGLVLPDYLVPISMALGEMIFLGGSLRYFMMQGERGQFLSRFLSPQVAQLVHERGMRNAMRTERLMLSVLCCDIRGFTAYARAVAPDRVIQVLREYYREVGQAVAEFGGTIKDQAGDGILILVGAPLAYDDHAQRALDMACMIRERLRPCLLRWSDEQLRLGVGVGVASGEVAVGVIGDATRLEYTAVGSAVNLASRLCGEAADGEIRIDEHSIELCGGSRQAGVAAPLQLKGFEQPVGNFVM